MTATWFLIGTAIGLTAASLLVGIPVFRRHYMRNLRRYEPQISTWVNQGNRAVIGQYEEILEAIRTETHFALWEHEMESEQS